jgi:hypothetical protein
MQSNESQGYRMTLKRCEYCGKHYQKLNEFKRCDSCEREFTFVSSKIIKRYSQALKGLASR